MKLSTILLFIFLFVSSGWSQKPKDLTTASTRAQKSVAVLRQFDALGADSLPFKYLQKAKAVAVFPGLTKVNILLSELTIGNGIISFRSGSNWSTPAFLAFKGTDTNLKIAAKKSFDTVFLFMDDEAVEWLKKSDIGFSSGSKKKAMIGPVIGGAGADTTLAQASLLYYTFDGGQLIDTDLSNNSFFKSFGILHDNNFNKAIFGMRTKALFAAAEDKVKVPTEIEKFRATLIDILSKSATSETTTNETVKDK